jgi:hypothetical protein
MIHPNMATMLAYVTTDAKVEASVLQPILSEAVEKSFNMTTVDGDTSTNDSIFILANGASGIEIKTEEDKPRVDPAEKSEVNAEEVKPREEDKSLDKPVDRGNARADEAPQNTATPATPAAPVPPADPTPPAAAPVRRARQPRNKSADTAVNEQKLSELLGL